MLVFVDESGDAGFKLGQGSSTHLVVAAVCFTDRNVAAACDAAIGEFRRAAGLSDRFEFHFSQTREDISLELLRVVEPFEFRFSACFMDKTQADVTSNRPAGPDLLAELAGQALQSLSGLAEAVVVVDGELPKPLQSQIERRLKAINRERDPRPVKKVKFSRSQGNNLLQLADVVSGAIFRSLTKRDRTFRRILRRHEGSITRRS